MSGQTYATACASHRWEVPERYNIAADVCDKHPRGEAGDGLGALRRRAARARRGASCRTSRTRRRTCWPRTASSAATASRWCCRRRRRRPRSSSAPGSSARSCSRCPSSTATTGSAHRLGDSDARLLVTDAANAPRFAAPGRRGCSSLDADTLPGAPTDAVCADTAADDPAQLYYTSGTTGLAKGIVHAHRYLLGHEEFTYCHEVQDGERFHGMGEWAWAAGIAPLLGPWRLGAVQCVYRRRAASTRTSSSLPQPPPR